MSHQEQGQQGNVFRLVLFYQYVVWVVANSHPLPHWDVYLMVPDLAYRKATCISNGEEV